jgi:hypothetical protein
MDISTLLDQTAMRLCACMTAFNRGLLRPLGQAVRLDLWQATLAEAGQVPAILACLSSAKIPPALATRSPF